MDISLGDEQNRLDKEHYSFSTSLVGQSSIQIRPIVRGIFVYLSKHGVKELNEGYKKYQIFFFISHLIICL